MDPSATNQHAPVTVEALMGANPWLSGTPVFKEIFESLILTTSGFTQPGQHRLESRVYDFHEELSVPPAGGGNPERILLFAVALVVRPDVAESSLADAAALHDLDFEVRIEGISALFLFRPPC